MERGRSSGASVGFTTASSAATQSVRSLSDGACSASTCFPDPIENVVFLDVVGSALRRRRDCGVTGRLPRC
eukprot:6317819-Prymnesium_polylepis.1